MKDNGGPAFPRPDERAPDGTGLSEGSNGMSLRDYFAGQALAGLCACNNFDMPDFKSWGAKCYEFADAMIAARG